MGLREAGRHHWRTHKNDALIVSFVMMVLSTLSFSVIAPISALSTRVDPVLLLSAGSLVALLAHIPFVKNLKQRLKTCPKRIYMLVGFGGGLVGWSYVLFTIALRQSDNAIIPVLIFELYPVVIIFLAGLFLAKQKIRAQHYFWMLVCLVGVAMLMLEGKELSYQGFIYAAQEELNMVAMVFSAVFLLAMGMVFIIKASRVMGGSSADSIFTSLLVRGATVLLTLPFVTWSQLGDFVTGFDIISLAHILAYGVFALTISNVLYYPAANINKSNLLHITMYLGPIFSAVWLFLLGLGSFTMATVLGGGLIILSVLRVTLTKQKC